MEYLDLASRWCECFHELREAFWPDVSFAQKSLWIEQRDEWLNEFKNLTEDLVPHLSDRDGRRLLRFIAPLYIDGASGAPIGHHKQVWDEAWAIVRQPMIRLELPTLSAESTDAQPLVTKNAHARENSSDALSHMNTDQLDAAAAMSDTSDPNMAAWEKVQEKLGVSKSDAEKLVGQVRSMQDRHGQFLPKGTPGRKRARKP